MSTIFDEFSQTNQFLGMRMKSWKTVEWQKSFDKNRLIQLQSQMGLECVRSFVHSMHILFGWIWIWTMRIFLRMLWDWDWDLVQCIAGMECGKNKNGLLMRKREKGYMNSMNCMGLDYSGLFYKSHICCAQYECAHFWFSPYRCNSALTRCTPSSSRSHRLLTLANSFYCFLATSISISSLFSHPMCAVYTYVCCKCNAHRPAEWIEPTQLHIHILYAFCRCSILVTE